MNFSVFDLNLLRVLDAILQEGSTVRAGERLGLSQSAVSSALARLRHAIGDPLFVRQGQRLVATDYAETLRAPLREKLDQIEALMTPRAAFDPSQAEGTFKIAGADFFAEMLMPRLGDMLLKTAPYITSQLVDLVPHDYVQSVERFGADLALIPDQDIPNWMNREPLFKSRYVVAARATNPGVADLSPGDVVPYDIFCALSHVLFSPEGNRAAAGDAALARVGRSRRVAMTVPIFAAVCCAVRDSDLIALVPHQIARKVKVANGLELFEPPMEIDAVQIVAIWHKRSDATPLKKWMREQVFEILKPLDDID